MKKIKVHYRGIDGYKQSQSFNRLSDARIFAQRWVGETPEVGVSYAISGDGVGRITVSGTGLFDLFPKSMW